MNLQRSSQVLAKQLDPLELLLARSGRRWQRIATRTTSSSSRTFSPPLVGRRQPSLISTTFSTVLVTSVRISTAIASIMPIGSVILVAFSISGHLVAEAHAVDLVAERFPRDLLRLVLRSPSDSDDARVAAPKHIEVSTRG